MKKQTSKERKRDERKSKSAARPTRHARIMRGVVTPILGLLAVACIGLGIMNATYWKPSSQIAASAAVKGTQYIVTDPGFTPLEKKQLLTEREYKEMREKYEDTFEAGMGAEAVQKLLAEIDLEALSAELHEELAKKREDKEKLDKVRRTALDTDPLYVLFTSGSTGMPKGVVGHHRGVIDYIDQLSAVLDFDEESVFGNQAPLYFDACMKDIYPTLKFGATTWLIPHELFLFPVRLVEYLNVHKINTICWVVSALTMISAFGTFKEVVPEYLRTVAFGSEVFPIRQFNLWKRTLPQVRFTNLYGPTEATGMSCYYHADREFSENEVIPIGQPFENTEILLLKGGLEAAQGEEGEICIRGTCLTHGYYGNKEKTKEAFVQNPLNPYYPELIYRTGDIGKRNAKGELIFVSRKDYQIKHMGHRIELGEIEANVLLVDGIQTACCIYPKEDEKIVLFYTGTLKKAELLMELKQRLPRYMIPNVLFLIEQLPLTPNGKMNRKAMEQFYMDHKKNKRRRTK